MYNQINNFFDHYEHAQQQKWVIKWTSILITVFAYSLTDFSQVIISIHQSYLPIGSILLLRREISRRSRYHALCQIGFYCAVSSSSISPSIFEGRWWSNTSKGRPIGTFQDNNSWLIWYHIYLMHGPWRILTVKLSRSNVDLLARDRM